MTGLKDLTPSFRAVRLLLAREKGHPEGDRGEGYDLLVPLGKEGRLDPAEWKAHQDACRVRHFKSDAERSDRAIAAQARRAMVFRLCRRRAGRRDRLSPWRRALRARGVRVDPPRQRHAHLSGRARRAALRGGPFHLSLCSSGELSIAAWRWTLVIPRPPGWHRARWTAQLCLAAVSWSRHHKYRPIAPGSGQRRR
jgi:hypothetical protein